MCADTNVTRFPFAPKAYRLSRHRISEAEEIDKTKIIRLPPLPRKADVNAAIRDTSYLSIESLILKRGWERIEGRVSAYADVQEEGRPETTRLYFD